MNIADSYYLIQWSKLTEKENSEIRFQELRLQKLNLSSSLARNGFFELQNSTEHFQFWCTFCLPLGRLFESHYAKQLNLHSHY